MDVISAFAPLPAQVGTLYSLWLTHIIDTGNRAIDSSLVATFVILSSVGVALLKILLVKFWRGWKEPSDGLIDDFTRYPKPSKTDFTFVYSFEETAVLTQFFNWFMDAYKTKKLPVSGAISLFITHDGTIREWSSFDMRTNFGKFEMVPIYKFKGDVVYLSSEAVNTQALAVLYSNTKESVSELLKLFSHKDVKNTNKLRLYTYNENGLWLRGDLDTRRTLKKLVLPEKEEILNVIRKFQTGTLRAKNSTVPNALGAICHGKRGCGKTSFGGALAVELNRHVVMVDTSALSCAQFRDLFRLDNLPLDKVVYVFDELDCVLDVIKKRESKDSDRILQNIISSSLTPEEYKEKMAEMVTTVRAEKSKLTLECMLKELDGLQNNDGRVIVAMTNHRKDIDSALVRACGRFGDLDICFGYCDLEMTKQALELCFDDGRLEIDSLEWNKYTENTWTVNKIFQLAATCNSLKCCFEEMCKRTVVKK